MPDSHCEAIRFENRATNPRPASTLPAMEPAPDVRSLLQAAQGFCELGMFLDANDELEKLPQEIRISREILAFRAGVYTAAEAWELLREVAGFLVKNWPEESQYWVLR